MSEPPISAVSAHDAPQPPPLPDSRRTADPFDADGAIWVAVSPRLATGRIIVVVTCWVTLLLLIGLPMTLLGAWSHLPTWLPWLLLAVWGGFLAWFIWLIRRQVAAWSYAERPEELLVRSGIMLRSIVVVPYGRLQYVDVTGGPLARRLGYATVQLHTASPGTDAAVPGVPGEEANRLRERLTARGQAQLAGL